MGPAVFGISFLILLIAIILLIFNLVKKKSIKLPRNIMLIGIALFIISLFLPGPDVNQSEANTKVEQEQVENNNNQQKEQEKLEKQAAEQKAKEEQAKKEAEEKAAAKEKEKKEAEEEARKKAEQEAKEREQYGETATVTRVIDGDTLEISMNGKTEDVRLLLIDTPETVHPSEPVEPFGPEASQFVKEKLEGKEVQVKVGKEERDNYGRLLAYVYIDGKTIQEMLLEEGLAKTAYLYNDLTMLDDFHAAQQPAIDAGIGVWSIPGYAHVDDDDGFHYEEEPEPEQEESEPEKEEPASTNVYYKNCTAVRDAGADPIRIGDPGYDTHLDRDGDGIGCE